MSYKVSSYSRAWEYVGGNILTQIINEMPCTRFFTHVQNVDLKLRGEDENARKYRIVTIHFQRRPKDKRNALITSQMEMFEQSI